METSTEYGITRIAGNYGLKMMLVPVLALGEIAERVGDDLPAAAIGGIEQRIELKTNRQIVSSWNAIKQAIANWASSLSMPAGRIRTKPGLAVKVGPPAPILNVSCTVPSDSVKR